MIPEPYPIRQTYGTVLLIGFFGSRDFPTISRTRAFYAHALVGARKIVIVPRL